MSCGVGHRHGLDSKLLWLWCRPAATALNGRRAWESPYASGSALKRQKDQKKKKNHYSVIIEIGLFCTALNGTMAPRKITKALWRTRFGYHYI